MDKRTKLFWSEPDMEPWPMLEPDSIRAALMQDLGKAEKADEKSSSLVAETDNL